MTDRMWKNLIEELENTNNVQGEKILSHGGEFNHIDEEIPESSEGWKSATYEGTFRQGGMHWIADESVPKKAIPAAYNIINDMINFKEALTPYGAAFGNATLRLVTSGKVIVGDGKITINLKKIGIYFRDSYDFDSPKYQPLGFWQYIYPYVTLRPSRIEIPLVTNNYFRIYNNGKGKPDNYGNFRIFSNVYKITTDQSYIYLKHPNVKPGNNCGNNKVYDCNLSCVDKIKADRWIGDQMCDDGEWGMVLTCPAFNNDGGDCN
jgi:hypothetical protein